MLLRNNLLASALIFALLEVWRPCFFLTDDNLDGGLPVLTEMGRHLLHGQSPFFSAYLFGGDYNLLRDATFFLWHPVYLLASLLGGTPYYYLIIDVCAFAFMMLATAGFTNLAWYLRREVPLRISDGWIMFYALSFTYSVFALAIGASWLNFLANQSALPWLALGILQKRWRAGIGLVALFSLHQILGGHPLPMISNTLFLSLFAIGVSVWRRSILPVSCWAAGSAIAVIVALPLLAPMLGGFFSTDRAGGVPLEDMQTDSIPGALFPSSYFAGMALWLVAPPEHVHITYTLAFTTCAAAWCLIPVLLSRAKWNGLEIVTLALIAFMVLMVCRPLWIAEIMIRLPVLRSMRWPFRELLQFLFFLHLFLLVRPPGLPERFRLLTACFSTLLMVVPMVLYLIPPTLNAMPITRHELFSGAFDRYWDQVRPLLKPTDRVAVLTTYDIYVDDHYERPNGLLATYNLSILAGVINAAGYSHTMPRDQTYTKTIPYFPNGAYEVRQKAALLSEKPDLKFITLESLHPIKITLSSADGPTIDLTPYVPADFVNAGRQR